MSFWSKLKELVRGLGRTADPPKPKVVTSFFELPALPALPALPLPKIDGVVTTTSTTVHTRTVLTEYVDCDLAEVSPHEVKVLIVDNVVKSIWSPCERVAALAAMQLGGESCARHYQEVVEEMRGHAKPWSAQWFARIRFTDRIKNRTARDTISSAAAKATRCRQERLMRHAAPASERQPPRIWEQLIRRATGLTVQVVVESMSVRVYVETPGASSVYTLIGNGTPMSPFGWALSSGPGDQRVYDLLNKHSKLSAKLVALRP